MNDLQGYASKKSEMLWHLIIPLVVSLHAQKGANIRAEPSLSKWSTSGTVFVVGGTTVPREAYYRDQTLLEPFRGNSTWSALASASTSGSQRSLILPKDPNKVDQIDASLEGLDVNDPKMYMSRGESGTWLYNADLSESQSRLCSPFRRSIQHLESFRPTRRNLIFTMNS